MTSYPKGVHIHNLLKKMQKRVHQQPLEKTVSLGEEGQLLSPCLSSWGALLEKVPLCSVNDNNYTSL